MTIQIFWLTTVIIVGFYAVATKLDAILAELRRTRAQGSIR